MPRVCLLCLFNKQINRYSDLFANRSKESEQTCDISRNSFVIINAITSWTWNMFIQIESTFIGATNGSYVLTGNFTFYHP